eukprot:CAMPEP_0204237938 /NCGR_PEP_ID=MMETSP0361-20130328/93616_1 /ASSEMBLY_ACC=CAM_ASM_000343 /TAXON_ID=268821 /ORGANISM="Scrippsiella Hangoei, Strain SHTV-5" /LENGTH=286 /DNA_ID=CAMNT_0051210707 /DNA_START=71 /DNA_END=933 /DNA_ORIENTATION=+
MGGANAVAGCSVCACARVGTTTQDAADGHIQAHNTSSMRFCDRHRPKRAPSSKLRVTDRAHVQAPAPQKTEVSLRGALATSPTPYRKTQNEIQGIWTRGGGTEVGYLGSSMNTGGALYWKEHALRKHGAALQDSSLTLQNGSSSKDLGRIVTLHSLVRGVEDALWPVRARPLRELVANVPLPGCEPLIDLLGLQGLATRSVHVAVGDLKVRTEAEGSGPHEAHALTVPPHRLGAVQGRLGPPLDVQGEAHELAREALLTLLHQGFPAQERCVRLQLRQGDETDAGL